MRARGAGRIRRVQVGTSTRLSLRALWRRVLDDHDLIEVKLLLIMLCLAAAGALEVLLP